MNFNVDNLVKSPLNYTGGKFKLLPQLLPLFPSKISTFYDIFGGGANVSVNCGAEHIYYNDIIPYVSKILEGMKEEGSIKKVLNVIDTYSLSKTNLEGFNKLRFDYNNGNDSWENLYALIVHSFNYQMRFNSNHKYNSSFGKNVSYFSPTLQSKFLKFAERLNNLDIVFSSKDFRDVDYSDANENDLVYFDPPYLVSCAVYQDGKRGFKGWGEQDEKDLLSLCDKLNKQGTRFALSNVLESKGKKNDILINWSKKYIVHYLDTGYRNSNYQRKDRDSKDIEVLITNYYKDEPVSTKTIKKKAPLYKKRK